MREHRKRIWIDSFQTGLVFRVAMYLFLYQGVVWTFNAYWDQISSVVEALGTDSPFLASNGGRSTVAFLTLAPPLILDAFRFAHRLVGPLYRFRKTIQAIAAGEPVALVQLRRGDLLMDFKEDFNLMLRALEERGAIDLKTPGEPIRAETMQAVR